MPGRRTTSIKVLDRVIPGRIRDVTGETTFISLSSGFHWLSDARGARLARSADPYPSPRPPRARLSFIGPRNKIHRPPRAFVRWPELIFPVEMADPINSALSKCAIVSRTHRSISPDEPGKIDHRRAGINTKRDNHYRVISFLTLFYVSRNAPQLINLAVEINAYFELAVHGLPAYRSARTNARRLREKIPRSSNGPSIPKYHGPPIIPQSLHHPAVDTPQYEADILDATATPSPRVLRKINSHQTYFIEQLSLTSDLSLSHSLSRDSSENRGFSATL